jgi:hypothetical protein
MSKTNLIAKRTRHPVNISTEAYINSKELAEKKNVTLVNYVNSVLVDNAKKVNFLTRYTNHIKEDYISEDTIYLKDSKLNKTAIVKLKEHTDPDLPDSRITIYCETCDSDSCIHVRFTLASNSILKLYSPT